jgi:hypothetical protein
MWPRTETSNKTTRRTERASKSTERKRDVDIQSEFRKHIKNRGGGGPVLFEVKKKKE